VPGTVVTIAGSGFGVAQGNGHVWLGTGNGVVQSWSDNTIVAQVATGSTTGSAQVLQNGVMSNAYAFAVNSLHLVGVSPASGGPLTSVTFNGTGFGSSQGSGTVLLGSAPGQVVSWSDTQIVAAVDPSALTGIAEVQQNGVLSNTKAFTVTSASPVTLLPNLLNLVVGDTHTIQAVNSAGQPVTGLTWTSTDSTIVSLSTDDPPLLTALAAGHVTITAGTAATDVTVSAGPLPLGTVLWSNPGPATGVANIVPAVPSPTGVADVFAFDQTNCSQGCTVQAITSDGTTAWTASLAAAFTVLPDFQGGLVAIEPSTANSNAIVKLDGITGQAYPTYTPTSPASLTGVALCTVGTACDGVAIHTDGTVFAIEFSNLAPYGNSYYSVVGIDPTSATQKFSVPINVPMIGTSANIPVVYGIMVAGDGYAYVPYAYNDDSGAHLALMRVDSSGDFGTIPIKDWGDNIDIGEGFLWPAMITNADQGVLLTWGNFSASPTEFGMATTTGTSVSLSAPAVAGQSYTLIPALQAQDGSYVGTAQTDSGSLMVAFDQTGVRWTVPNEQPQIATADGGFIGQSGVTYDQNGSATGQVNMLTESWRGKTYQIGSTEQVASAPTDDAPTFAAVDGGNLSAAAPGQPKNGPYLIPETIYVRSFAPWELFGPEPPVCFTNCFYGDNRSFTTDLEATARVTGIVKFWMPGAILGLKDASSDPSIDIFGRTQTGSPRIRFAAASQDTGYSLHMEFAGSNPLVPGAPDINTKLDFTPLIDSGQLCFWGHLYGDAFPNAEVFAVNSALHRTMLLTFTTSGDPNTGPILLLPGDNNRDMGSFQSQCISR